MANSYTSIHSLAEVPTYDAENTVMRDSGDRRGSRHRAGRGGADDEETGLKREDLRVKTTMLG